MFSLAHLCIKRYFGLVGDSPIKSSKKQRRQTCHPARKTRRAKLSLELLEDRVNPSTFTWVGASGADWDTLANWKVAGITATVLPAITDTVDLNSFTGSLAHAVSGADTVNNIVNGTLATLSISSGSLTVA